MYLEYEYEYPNSVVVVKYFPMSTSTSKERCLEYEYEHSNSVVVVKYFPMSTSTSKEKCISSTSMSTPTL